MQGLQHPRLSGGRALACLAIVAVIAGCSGRVASTPTPSLPDPTAAAVVSAEPSPTELPTHEPSTPGLETTAPADTTQASAAPTTKPPAVAPTKTPSPTPTCTVSVKDPVSIGEAAQVTVKCPVGPTCALVVKYPNGQAATLPSPTHPNPGWWRWRWTIPANARAGEAKGTATCTGGGVQVSKSTSFTIKAAPWSIRVDVPSPFDHTTLPEIGLFITVTIVGTMPVNPSYDVQSVLCTMEITPESGGLHRDGFEVAWNNGYDPITWTWQLAFDASEVGTASWTMQCKNYYVSPVQWRYDSGTMEIT